MWCVSPRTPLRSPWFVGAFALLLVLGCGTAPPPQAEVVVPTPDPHAQAVAVADPSPAPGTAVPVTSADPAQGDPLAPVTLVEWGDFQCPFTGKLVATIRELQRMYGEDKLRVVWKHNPLPFHDHARLAHAASQAVFELGGARAFWVFHGLAFQNQRDLTAEKFAVWAEQAGVDPASFKAAVEDGRSAVKVDKDLEVGKSAGVTGTPASFINGVFVSGAQPIETFKKVIDEQLQAAEALERSGIPRERIYAELSDKNHKSPPPPKPHEPSADDDTKTVWRVPIDGSPVRGKPEALVTIVTFTEFQCPFCGRVKPTIDTLLGEYGDKVRLVVKHNPLPFHPHAEPAAELVIEARAQQGDAGFWKAFDLLFANQKQLEDADLEGYAKSLGMNAPRAMLAITSHKYKATIAADQDLAEDLQANGTPHFFINGRRLVGAQPIEKFRSLIDEEVARATEVVKHGTPAARVYDTLQKDAHSGAVERIVVPRPTKANPSKGPPNAKVVVQMFSDFQCPFCKRAAPTMDALLAAFPGQVRIVWRHNPLPMHRDAPLAAEAAAEAFEQKGDAAFWKMEAMLFEDQGAAGIERPQLERRAAELGLDMTRFNAALDTHKHDAEIRADMALAAKLGISGVPAFAIDDYFVSGAMSLGTFSRRVRKALGPYEPILPGSLHGAPRPAVPPQPVGVPAAVAPQKTIFGAKHLMVSYAGAMRAPPGITRTRDEALARATEAMAKAKSGVRFEDLVTLYSDEPGAAARGGDLGRFPQGSMVPAFQQEVERTPVGSTSNVVETQFGFHVILRTQ